MSRTDLWRRMLAERLGSALLAGVVIGSGIAAQRLLPGETGLELFENVAANAAGLYALILMFGPVSGAHFNPVVSFVDAAFGGIRWRTALFYVPAQVAGCIRPARKWDLGVSSLHAEPADDGWGYTFSSEPGRAQRIIRSAAFAMPTQSRRTSDATFRPIHS
jgi:hypothetical protein